MCAGAKRCQATAEAKRSTQFLVRSRSSMECCGRLNPADRTHARARRLSLWFTRANSSPLASTNHWSPVTNRALKLGASPRARWGGKGRNGQSTFDTCKSQKTNDGAHARAELPGAFSFSVFGAHFESRPRIPARGPRNAPRFGVVARHSQPSRNAPKSQKTNNGTCVYPERPGAHFRTHFAVGDLEQSGRNLLASASCRFAIVGAFLRGGLARQRPRDPRSSGGFPLPKFLRSDGTSCQRPYRADSRGAIATQPGDIRARFDAN